MACIVHAIPSWGRAAPGEGDDGEDGEVGAAGKVGQLGESGLLARVVRDLTLSNLKVHAMEKKKSWYPMVMSSVIAR